MAKASVTCKCTKCGKEFIKTKICSSRAEADRFEKWAVENANTCPDCFKKIRDEKEAEKGLSVLYSIDISGARKGVLCEMAVISGATYSHRHDLSEFGFEYVKKHDVWTYSFPVSMENPKDPETESRIEHELNAQSTGYVKYESRLEKAIILINDYNEKLHKKNAELSELGDKPEFPEEFTSLMDGRRWNGTIYGKSEKSVYFDGQKVYLSDELANKVIFAIEKRKDWDVRKSEIEKKYE